MQLTDILSLDKEYTNNDVNEMAAVMQSTHLSSPSAEVRWGKVKKSDAETWMRANVALSMKEEFAAQRISAALDFSNRNIPPISYAEHLIVRDLDLEHIGPTTKTEPPGRVIAHADWRYTPCFSGDIADTPNGVNSMEDKQQPLHGFNQELHDMLNESITSSIKTYFCDLPFFYLLGISTLTPSHLRKGIAKRLVQWIDPYIDHYSMPVVLYASPLGLHLYRSCGYEEYRDLDVAIDLEKWGVTEVHRHVVMIRWPKDESRLPDAWKEWRKNHSTGQSSEELPK